MKLIRIIPILLLFQAGLSLGAQTHKTIAIRPSTGYEVDFFFLIEDEGKDTLKIEPKNGKFILSDEILEKYGHLPCKLVFKNGLDNRLYFNRLYESVSQGADYLDGDAVQLEALAKDTYNTYYLQVKGNAVLPRR